ncbi:MAG: diguanylate cyclase/phosphodiesterase with sensor(s) [Ilumatobacteraceae bacterium]|nr:diguanylate cyclase/phosphodiesterase with sensor(s) [Ilumatobacteraceae bacterium]
MNLVVRVTTREQRITWVSSGFAAGIGLPGQDLVGRPIFEILDSVWTPELRTLFSAQNQREVPEPEDVLVVKILSAHPTPACFQLRSAGSVTDSHDSVVAQLVPITTDTFDAQVEIANGEHLYAALARGSSDGIVIYDSARILFVNDVTVEMSDASGSETLIGLPISDLIRADAQPALDVISERLVEDAEASFDIELLVRRPSGLPLQAQGSVERVMWAGRPAVQVVLHDTSPAETRSDTDRVALGVRNGIPLDNGLSGLAALLTWLDHAQPDTLSVVVLLDVDHFGRLNARSGYSAGDDVLSGLDQRLRADVRADEFAVKLSADRFAMCATVIDGRSAYEFAERVGVLTSEPLLADGSLLSISVSSGAAWGANAGNAIRLFEQAERALEDAQVQGGHRLCFYEAGDPGSWADEASFARDLRAGLADGQIFVAYQPIVELATGDVRKVEALARWTHPERGNVPPSVFIPIAENFGLIDQLGEWVLQSACVDVVAMDLEGVVVDVSVNLSVVQLRDPSVVERIALILAGTGLDPTRLWIEVTESVLLDDRALLPLHQLRDLGVHLVIDDFGTGFATFRYLTRLPVEALKIDTTFVWGLGIDASDTAIVRSVVNLGRELGLEVIAEGVETESQRSQLLALHCRLAQGWLFDRALTYAEFIDRYCRPGDDETVVVDSSGVAGDNESARIAALRACRIMDTSPDPAFDSLVQLAAELLTVPMALVSFVDTDRQWFKARYGVDLVETPRATSFCSHAIRHPLSPFVVADTSLDERFDANPVVTGPPHIRSYAGIPILSRESLPIGTLCVLDTVARAFTDEQLGQLSVLAEQAAALADLRRRTVELSELLYARAHDATDASSIASLTNLAALEVGRALVLAEAVPLDGRPGTMIFGPLSIDLAARSVRRDDDEIALTVKEFDVLVYLASHADSVVSRTELLTEVWHSAPAWQASSTVTEHIYRLRSKIEEDPANPTVIVTVRGIGYRFCATTSTTTPSDDRRQAESISRSQHDRISAPPKVVNVPDAVIVTDPELHILSWNTAAQHIYGWSEAEVLGRNIRDVVFSADQRNTPIDPTELGETGRWHHPVRHTTREGVEIAVIASVSALRDDRGDVTALVVVNRLVPARSDTDVGGELGSIDVSDVRRALDRHEFVVYYEPIVLLTNRQVVAVRTRTRWLRPNGETWEAAAFVDAFIRAGALDELTAFICTTAATQAERWHSAGEDVAITIELRGEQLAHTGVIAALTDTTARLALSGLQVWFEVAQSVVADIGAAGRAGLDQLTSAGARISIRGFGIAGTHVTTREGAHIPVHALKIDASLINSIDNDVQISDFVRSLLAAGAAMAVPVAAEGVTNASQHSALHAIGCLAGQGPFYGVAALGDHVALDRAQTILPA